MATKAELLSALKDILAYEREIGVDPSLSRIDPKRALTSDRGTRWVLEEAGRCRSYLRFCEDAGRVIAADGGSYGELVKISDRTPDLLQGLGYADLPMFATPRHIADAVKLPGQAGRSQRAHEIARADLMRVPEAMREPVCVLESRKGTASIVVLDMADLRGAPVCLVVDPYGVTAPADRQRRETNFVLSIYGRSQLESDLARAAAVDTLLYVDSRRLGDLLEWCGMEAPDALSGLDGMIRDSPVAEAHRAKIEGARPRGLGAMRDERSAAALLASYDAHGNLREGRGTR